MQGIIPNLEELQMSIELTRFSGQDVPKKVKKRRNYQHTYTQTKMEVERDRLPPKPFRARPGPNMSMSEMLDCHLENMDV